MSFAPSYEIKNLEDHAEIISGPSFASSQFTASDNDVPLVKGENLHQGFIDWGQAKRWPAETAVEYERFHLAKDDIVVAMDRPWVTAGLKWSYIRANDPDSLLVQRVARIRSKKLLDQKFLRCLIGSSYFAGYIQPIVTGVNVPHISAKQIGRFQIPLPSLSVQEKIAAILTAYDDLIENSRQRIALLEKMAEEIYREWFVRLRFPGHEHTPMHKGVPEGWRTGRLSEAANMVFGQSPPSEFYNSTGEGLPFHQGVGSYGNRFPSHDTFCSVDGRKAEAGSILFSVRAPVGRLNIADRRVILGRGLAGLNEVNGRNSYLLQLLKSHFSREDLIGNGAIFASVSKKELEQFPIFLPSEALVDRFQGLTEPIDRQIAQLHQSSVLLEKTRHLLLNRLISGKLRVDDLDIQFPPNMQAAEAAA